MIDYELYNHIVFTGFTMHTPCLRQPRSCCFQEFQPDVIARNTHLPRLVSLLDQSKQR